MLTIRGKETRHENLYCIVEWVNIWQNQGCPKDLFKKHIFTRRVLHTCASNISHKALIKV